MVGVDQGKERDGSEGKPKTGRLHTYLLTEEVQPSHLSEERIRETSQLTEHGRGTDITNEDWKGTGITA